MNTNTNTKNMENSINLHENFILIHEFEHPEGYIKQRVRDDETYIGNYHEDWNTLMPVLEKIEALGYDTTMKPNELIIWDKNENPLIDCLFAETKIGAAYQSILSFVTWYKDQPKD